MCKVKKIDYIKYRYPVKDEFTGEIVTWKEISGKEFQKLTPHKRKKIKEIGQEIFNEEAYNKAIENCEETSNKLTEKDIKNIVKMITDIYRDVSIEVEGYYIDEEFVKSIDDYDKNEIEALIKDKIENYVGKIVFLSKEHPVGVEEIIEIDKNNPVKTLRKIIKEFMIH